MSGAPIGEVFSATVNGQERAYHIRPRVFSAATMEALGRLYKKGLREQLSENLKVASEIRKADVSVYQDFMKEVAKQATSNVFVGYEQSLEALATRDGMATALKLNCDEVENIEQAYELIDSCDNVVELMGTLVSAGNEALEAAKNSDLSETLKSEEVPALSE